MTQYVDIAGFSLRCTDHQVWATQERLADGWIPNTLPYTVIIKDELHHAAAADWCKSLDSFYLVDYSDWRTHGAIYRFQDASAAMIFKLTWLGT